jgi:hypothetical protein
MKMHDKAVIKIMRLRESLVKMRSATWVEANKIALSALIDEVDKLPSIASDLFADEPVTMRVQGPRSFPFADLKPGEHFDVEFDRVNSLRACASGFARRHGMTLTVREKPNGGARCVRVDGFEGVPLALAELQKKAAPRGHVAPSGARPVAAASGVVLDRPAPPAKGTAPYVEAPADTSIEDPQTADEVRAAMAVPEDDRTEWQQVIVEEFQHLIDFEHVKPGFDEVNQAVLTDRNQRTPRQAWLVAKHMDVVIAGRPD